MLSKNFIDSVLSLKKSKKNLSLDLSEEDTCLRLKDWFSVEQVLT